MSMSKRVFVTALVGVAVWLSRETTPFPQDSRPSAQSESRNLPVPPDSCPITQPPSKPFVPPAPYPNKITDDSFWLGSEELWTSRSKNAIDAAANTHVWRHGEPTTEPLGNIFQDAFMPKPGVTPLMRAAAKADVNSINEAIARGDDIDAVDSSGWTALMYSAASSHSEPVQLLLKAGANPNHKSFAGDTPLMASAIARQFDEDLLRGGAEINSKNADGVSALMILAATGEADEVKAVINAGADASAKDAKGRSALDYLRLANCGKSPIVEWHTFEISGYCSQLDEDEVKQVASLLRNAKQKPKN